MPKVYSTNEKELLRNELKKQAQFSLIHYGVKKTTVDKLVNAVSIPKGTFYLLYNSKETLLFEILLEFHHDLEQKLIKDIEELPSDPSIEDVTKVFLNFYKFVDLSDYIKILTSDDIDLLLKKIPRETLDRHFEEDEEWISSIFDTLQIKRQNISLFSSAFKNMFYLLIRNHEQEEPNFYLTLELFIKGLVMQMYTYAIS